MNNNIKVSVLIPVFNTEKYLRRCLDSVINQTLKDIEIIIINDGSTDSSEEIIREYINRDSRIIYSKQKNSGLGATRNNGLKLAKGEYIAFLDSDDWVELNCYEIMYSTAQKDNSDLVVSDYYIDSLNSSNIYTHNFKDKNDYLRKVIRREIAGFSWNKLYKRMMILENNLRFPERGELENVEDQFFSIRCAFFSNRIIQTKKPLVHYIIREGSIVNIYQKDLIKDGIELYINNIKIFNKNNDYIYDSKINMIYHICQSVSNECKKNKNLSLSNRVYNIKKIAQQETVREIIDEYKNNRLLKENISKETRITLNLLISKRYILLLIIKFFRIKLIDIRTKKIGN